MTTTFLPAHSPAHPPRKPLRMIPNSVHFLSHQVDAIRQMCRMGGALLADEMGLGKTITALAVAACAFEEHTASRVLIVCPVALKGNWADEIADMTRFTSMVLPALTPKKRREVIQQYVESGTDILIVNYEQVLSHEDDLNRVGFNIVIADEAHYIKGHGAKRTKALHRLRAPRRFALTGSPVLNQVDDLWSLLHFAQPREWPSYWRFRGRYAALGGYMDKQVVGIMNEAELRDRLPAVMIQRFKRDCLDLPEKQRIPVRVDLLPEQRKLYDQANSELQIDLPNADPMEISNHLVKMLRLKQICGTTLAIEGHADHSAKLDQAVDMIQQWTAAGECSVVFTQFRSVLKALGDRLAGEGIPCWQLHGDVPHDERKPAVNAWRQSFAGGKPGVMACMFQVGGVGLTMVEARKVILIDKVWSPKLNDQAVDRLHRIGQRHEVQVYELIARNTIESRIESILKQKTAVNDAISSDDPAWRRQLIAAMQAKDSEGEDE